MGKRSFLASREGVRKLIQAFNKYGGTQDYLGREVNCTRQTVNKFLMGKPISKELFKSLCDKLNLEWEGVAELNADHKNENSNITYSVNEKLDDIFQRVELVPLPEPDKSKPNL